MEKKMKLSKGIRKYIRKKKSRIRKTVHDPTEQQKEIDGLLAKFTSEKA